MYTKAIMINQRSKDHIIIVQTKMDIIWKLNMPNVMTWNDMKHHTTSLGKNTKDGGGGVVATTRSSGIGILAIPVSWWKI